MRAAIRRIRQRLLLRFLLRFEMVRDLDGQVGSMSRRIASLQSENRELAERIPAIAARLAQVSLQQDSSTPHRRLRLCLEIDPVMVEHSFLHGDDNQVIEHIGEWIGRRAAHEIQRANFQRWEV